MGRWSQAGLNAPPKGCHRFFPAAGRTGSGDTAHGLSGVRPQACIPAARDQEAHSHQVIAAGAWRQQQVEEVIEEIVKEVKQEYKRTVRVIDESHAAKLFEKFVSSLRN